MEDFLKEYELHKDNDVELSNMGVKLASMLFTKSTSVAEAELDEKKETVRLLNDKEVEKKRSVAESEITAVVNTKNLYGMEKLELEAAYEVLNMVKMRIKVLMNERDNQ